MKQQLDTVTTIDRIRRSAKHMPSVRLIADMQVGPQKVKIERVYVNGSF